jgi:hypothetical protein
MEWRDDQGNTGSVDFPYQYWDPAADGWDDVYCTHGNNVEFPHAFVQADWPRGGHTAEEAKRYFDVKWDAYRAEDSQGDATPAYNCWSYAFGRTDYWVDGDAEIYANDYEAADASNADVARFSGHSVKITGRILGGGQDPTWHIRRISQKDRGSAIFEYTWDINGPYWDQKLNPVYAGVGSLWKKK